MKQVLITFTKKSTTSPFANFLQCELELDKAYPAELYAPFEEDDLGNPGIELPYYVLRNELGQRVGYAKDYDDDSEFTVVDA